MAWWDVYKLFYWLFKPDPISEFEGLKDIEGEAVTSPDMPDIRGQWSGGPGGPLRVKVGESDFIDLSSVTNRISRYKEYDRLDNVPEIQTALTTFADEACVSGDTLVATPFGFIPMKELAESKKLDDKFLVYCWDFKANDYTLGWAYNPRKVKTAKTIKVMFDNGQMLNCTPDHRVLLKNGEWVEAGDLKHGDELTPFYRIKANQNLTKLKTQQYPRVFTNNRGWIHERQFLDEWKTGKPLPGMERVNKTVRLIQQGLNMREISEAMGYWWKTIEAYLAKEGFAYKEMKWIVNKYEDSRRVVGIIDGEEIDVYDLSVEEHECFATDSCIVHNCQEDDDGHVFKVKTKNEEIKHEIEFLLYTMLEVNDRIWSWAKNLYKYGDFFLEIVTDPSEPKRGVLKIQPLPSDSIYRIETIKGKLIEFQQSKEGPDFNSLARVEVTKASQAELEQATALRFVPEQIIHMKVGDDRKSFYPYGVSVIEAARGPAHQLRLMEDAMLVYRLCLVGNSRVRTRTGWKYIKDIALGDEVYSLSHKNGLIPSMVTWLVDNGIKIWLSGSSKNSAERMMTRDKLASDKAMEIVKKRYQENKRLYKKLYNFDFGDDLSVFDKIIDTDNLNAQEVLEIAKSFVREKI